MITYILKDTAITVFLDGAATTIYSENENFEKAKEAIRNQDIEELRKCLNPIEKVKSWVVGDLEVKGNTITYKGSVVHNYIIDKILNLIEEELDPEPLLKFLEKLMQNPSNNCVNQLYEFLEHGNMPICPDGDFIGYKGVRNNYKDIYSGKFSNEIGETVSMPRNAVDDIRDNACSNGLHVGSIDYAKSYSSYGSGSNRIVLVKVNPANVVSVPSHDTRKLRCCEYKVIAEYEKDLSSTYYRGDDGLDLDNTCPDCNYNREDCECDEICHGCGCTYWECECDD